MTQHNTIQDEDQRTKALSPSHSFIVQAPAGSGKTELLTQRVLVLLGHVKTPEEILAVTFTKKSAAEMKARILSALKNAANNQEPASAHAKKTWHLARRVLQHDSQLKWNLLANPNRLRIQTIDSLNASLTRQLPILSHFGAAPDITDDPYPLYHQAAAEFLSHLEENLDWSDAIADLLIHLDNNVMDVESLLVNLLAKRDQWLPYIMLQSGDPRLRKKLESHLASVMTDLLASLKTSFPSHLTDELLFLARYAAHNLLHENTSSPICLFSDLENSSCAFFSEPKYALALCELLLKKDNDWRKQIDKSIGFPAATSFKNKDEKNKATDTKQRMSELLNQLYNLDEFKNALIELRLAPETRYQETQWRTLKALLYVLHIAVAQLRVVFQQHGKIDYIENAQAALTALGSTDAPTDLTLALDYQIKHILVDEFQDTSNSQYQLLEKLTAGWETNDGRTLFLVGDPMQSIYRFREAEVGLFIRTCHKGIRQIHLEPLTLSVNFRSTATVVNWVNQTFPHVFPSFNDIASGAVSYSKSIANQSIDSDLHHPSVVELHPFLNENNEKQADAIAQLILEKRQLTPDETIAILVRARTHLENIIPALKKHKLPYRAIDIDPLNERPFIQDLMALTRALLHPADRIAWLAILRAPWCGLSLADLLHISGSDPTRSLWERLQSPTITDGMSDAGKINLLRILPILTLKFSERRRYSLRYWIESTWLLLGGAACIEQENDLEDAEAYFKLLDKLDHGGDLPNLDELNSYVSRLYATPDNQANTTLQIMTIHNAKGLEFDTVILPHLERKSSNDDKQLLLWLDRPRQDESTALLIAPIHAVGNERDSIYEFIKRQQVIKNDYEKSRLMYVAATRAKKQLHLFFNVKSDKEGKIKPAANSLLDKLWPAIHNDVENRIKPIESTLMETTIAVAPYQPQILQRLSTTWRNPVSENRLADSIAYHQKNAGFKLPHQTPKLTGTLIHQILQHIALYGETKWENCSQTEKKLYLESQLKQLGIIPTELSGALDTVLIAIKNTLNDTRGKWILTPHKQAKTEFPITAVIDNKVQQLIIDRTFIDEHHTRWIIDYKTALCPADKNLTEFLTEQQKKYQEKMWHYHQAMNSLDEGRIRMGLYFPLIPAWREWEF